MLIKEFDALSQNVKIEIINVTENNFAKVTADNIVRAMYVIIESASYGYDKVQIAQAEIAMRLNLSENRISELLKLSRKAGLIAIEQICRCGDIRNEYTLLDNPIVNSIKNVIFKSQVADNKDSINKAIEQAMYFYRGKGEQEYILETVKNRIENINIIKASGVFNYFKKTLRTVKRESIEPIETIVKYENSKKDTWNNYEQRPYDPSIEKQLLEKNNEENEEPFDMKSSLNKLRE